MGATLGSVIVLAAVYFTQGVSATIIMLALQARHQTAAHFRELACIIAGHHGTYVIVGATPPTRWATQAPHIEHAISGF